MIEILFDSKTEMFSYYWMYGKKIKKKKVSNYAKK